MKALPFIQVSILLAFVAGSDAGLLPLPAKPIPGHLTLETWYFPKRFEVIEFQHSPEYSRPPYERRHLPSARIEGIGAHVATRVRGYLTVPGTGDYHFWLSSHHGAELWLSGDASKFSKKRIIAFGPRYGTGEGIRSEDENPWDRFVRQKSAAIPLEKGKSYYFEAVQQSMENVRTHLSLAWRAPGGKRELIPLSSLSSCVLDPLDLDDNALPDAWEKKHRLNSGEHADPDRDGLTNREEFLLGTKPQVADTDQDGLPDAREVRGYLTDPTIANPLPHSERGFHLADAHGDAFFWNYENDRVACEEFRGSVNLPFTSPAEDLYDIDIIVGLEGELFAREEMDLTISLAGRILEQRSFIFGENHEALIHLPGLSLRQEKYQIKVQVHNLASRRSLVIKKAVFRPAIAKENLHSRLLPFLEDSPVSPAFLEGAGRRPISLNGDPLEVGSHWDQWYTNLPLRPEGATRFNLFHGPRDVQGGQITWIPTNILAGGEITLRKGDSLKLVASTASGTGLPVEITVPSPKNWARHPKASASHSSSAYGGSANRIIDGDPKTQDRTNFKQTNGSLQVDLGDDRLIDRVELWGHPSGGVRDHQHHYSITVLDSAGQILGVKKFHMDGSPSALKEEYVFPAPVLARIVRVQSLKAAGEEHKDLYFSELKAFGFEKMSLASDRGHLIHQFDIPGTHKLTAHHASGTTGTLTVHVKRAEFWPGTRDFVIGIPSTTEGNKPILANVSEGLTFGAGPNIDLERFGGHHLRVLPKGRGSTRITARLHPGGPIVGFLPINLYDVSDRWLTPLSPAIPNQRFPGYRLHRIPFVAEGLVLKDEDAGVLGSQLSFHLRNDGCIFLNQSSRLDLFGDQSNNGLHSLLVLVPEHFDTFGNYHVKVYDRHLRVVSHSR